MPATQQARQDDPLKGFTIPPMPESLTTIHAEDAKPDPDVGRISDAIANDVSLAAEVLKTVNSPYFGLSRPLSSVPNAVAMLGLNNVVNIATAVGLRAAMQQGQGPASLDRFWDTAGDVAFAAAALAKELTGIPRDVAYSLGLFHDCGIPLMAQRFANYFDVLRAANLDAGHTIAEVESEHFRLNHAEVGYHIARNWHLPEEIANAIRYHHRYAELQRRQDELGPNVMSLVSLLKLAEHISESFRAAFRPVEDDSEWERASAAVLGYFELDRQDYDDLHTKLMVMLGQR